MPQHFYPTGEVELPTTFLICNLVITAPSRAHPPPSPPGSTAESAQILVGHSGHLLYLGSDCRPGSALRAPLPVDVD
eukprot:scaffold14938_cov130-Isochrysis_galbana.AAC.4